MSFSSSSSSIESFDVICGRVGSLESSVFGSANPVTTKEVVSQRLIELESKVAIITQKVPNYNQIDESFRKLGIKAPLDELTATFLTDIEKKLVDILSFRSQLDIAIKQLQQVEAHRHSLSASSTIDTSSDEDVHNRLDAVELTLLQLSHQINDDHTAQLDNLLASYETLMIDFSDALVQLNMRLRVLE